MHNHSPNFYKCMSDTVKIWRDIPCTMKDKRALSDENRVLLNRVERLPNGY